MYSPCIYNVNLFQTSATSTPAFLQLHQTPRNYVLQLSRFTFLCRHKLLTQNLKVHTPCINIDRPSPQKPREKTNRPSCSDGITIISNCKHAEGLLPRILTFFDFNVNKQAVYPPSALSNLEKVDYLFIHNGVFCIPTTAFRGGRLVAPAAEMEQKNLALFADLDALDILCGLSRYCASKVQVLIKFRHVTKVLKSSYS